MLILSKNLGETVFLKSGTGLLTRMLKRIHPQRNYNQVDLAHPLALTIGFFPCISLHISVAIFSCYVKDPQAHFHKFAESKLENMYVHGSVVCISTIKHLPSGYIPVHLLAT